MALRILLYSAPSAQAELALEEALHEAIETGRSPNTWRLWQARSPALIIGTGQVAGLEVDLQTAAAEGVPVVRRHSGGGAVLIGPGVLNFSACYAYSALPGSGTIRGALAAVLRPVCELLAKWKLTVLTEGLSDLALQRDGIKRKIGGNSQARKRLSVLVHGTLLADPEWPLVARLLPYPSAAPEYRLGRGHRDFLTSLRENAAPYALDSLTEELPPLLGPDIMIERAPSEWEAQEAGRLVREKYGLPEWNLRR